MSYNSETGIISAPVSIDDVKRALGESSNDLATLCKSENILLWAKYKPTNYSIDFVNDTLNSDKQTWTATDKTKAWWLGEARRYQTVYNFNVVNSLKQAKQIGAWNYNRPAGTPNSPYRLSDFIGYNSYDDGDEFFPFNVYCSPDIIYNNSTIHITFDVGEAPTHPNNVISVDDIFNMLYLKFGDKDHLYLGFFIANETTKKQGCVSCIKPISKLDINIGGDPILTMSYHLSKGLLANSEDVDLYQYGALLCGKVSDGDIITVVPMIFSTSNIYESFNAVFTPGIVFPKVSNYNFVNPIHSRRITAESEKPTVPITSKFTISNLKVSKSNRTLYWGNDNLSYVIRNNQMLDVSFDLEGTNLKGFGGKIKIYAIGNDSDGSYIESKEIYFPSTWYGGKLNLKNFISKGYTYYNQAAKHEIEGDDFIGVPIGVTLMINENTPLNGITQWNVYIEITADSFYDNDNNYIWNFKYEGDVLNENGLIYTETY